MIGIALPLRQLNTVAFVISLFEILSSIYGASVLDFEHFNVLNQRGILH